MDYQGLYWSVLVHQKYSNVEVDKDVDKDKGNAMDAIIFIHIDTTMHMYPGSVREFLDSEEGDEREVNKVREVKEEKELKVKEVKEVTEVTEVTSKNKKVQRP